LNKRVGLFHISIEMDYFANKTAEMNKFVVFNEKCEVKFTRIMCVIGLFSQNTVKNTLQKKENLIDPTHFQVRYQKTLENDMLIAAIDIALEQIHVQLGFRDMDFFQTLVSNLKVLATPPDPASSKTETSPVPMKFSLEIPSLTLKLTDDTVIRPIAILFINLYSISLNANVSPTQTFASLFSKLSVQCYNQSVSEFLLEEWEFEVKFHNKQNEIPFSISLTSEKVINLNISENMIESIEKLNSKFKQDPQFWTAEVKNECLKDCVVIVNDLGEDVIVHIADEPIHSVARGERIVLKNMNKEGDFSSHFILQADGCDQVLVEVGETSKDFSLKRGNVYLGCLLMLQEHTEETTFIMQTATIFHNFTEQALEISTSQQKLQILPGQEINAPLVFVNQDLFACLGILLTSKKCLRRTFSDIWC
jgi:hypothetical protein